MSISSDVVNEALYLIGYDGPEVTGAAPGFDGSTAGEAAELLYGPAIAAAARMQPWDSLRQSQALALSGLAAPFPWSFEYLYPPNCAEINQLTPQAIADPFNPVPVDWVRGVRIVASVQQSVIWANLNPANAVFTSMSVETTWDPLFRADVVRYLAAEFAIALLGKPDLAQTYFEQLGTMTQLGASRSDT